MGYCDRHVFVVRTTLYFVLVLIAMYVATTVIVVAEVLVVVIGEVLAICRCLVVCGNAGLVPAAILLFVVIL